MANILRQRLAKSLLLMLAVLIFSTEIHQVQAAESDCLEYSYPSIYGATNGDTYVKAHVVYTTQTVIMGGCSNSATVNGQGGDYYPFMAASSGSAIADWFKVYYEGTRAYDCVTAIVYANSLLYVVLRSSSGTNNGLMTVSPSNGNTYYDYGGMHVTQLQTANEVSQKMVLESSHYIYNVGRTSDNKLVFDKVNFLGNGYDQYWTTTNSDTGAGYYSYTYYDYNIHQYLKH